MKTIWKYPLVFLTAVLLPGCQPGEEEDCMKTVTIPQIYFVNNQSYSYDTTQEVPCDFPEPSEPEVIEAPVLEGFSYEVLNFEFTPDTGNNTSRLQFEIKLNNSSDHAVSGIPVLTINTDELQVRGSFSNKASVPCYQIEENSSCILTYDQQSSLDLDMTKSMELVNVEYILTQ